MHHIHSGQAPQYIPVRRCIRSFCTQWQILTEVDCMAQRITFCQEQELDLENEVSPTVTQPPGTLFLPTSTTLLTPIHSENDSRVYFLIVLTTDYCWRSWTYRIAAPYKFHIDDWLIDWLIDCCIYLLYGPVHVRPSSQGSVRPTDRADVWLFSTYPTLFKRNSGISKNKVFSSAPDRNFGQNVLSTEFDKLWTIFGWIKLKIQYLRRSVLITLILHLLLSHWASTALYSTMRKRQLVARVHPRSLILVVYTQL